jgi:hypothetical protein
VSSLADDDRPGRPHTAYIPETVKHGEGVTRENCHVTTDDVASELGISHGSAHHIVHEVLQCHKCVQGECQDKSLQN